MHSSILPPQSSFVWRVFAALKLLCDFWVSLTARQELKRWSCRTSRPPSSQSDSIWRVGDETQKSNSSFNESKVDRHKEDIPLKSGDTIWDVSPGSRSECRPPSLSRNVCERTTSQRLWQRGETEWRCFNAHCWCPSDTSRLNNFLWFKMKVLWVSQSAAAAAAAGVFFTWRASYQLH